MPPKFKIVHGTEPLSRKLENPIFMRKNICNALDLLKIKASGGILCALHKTTSIQRRVIENNEVVEDVLCRTCSLQAYPSAAKDEGSDEHTKFFMDLFPRLIGHEDQQVQMNTVMFLLKPMAFHGLINSQ